MNNQLRTLLLLGGLSALLIAVGSMLGGKSILLFTVFAIVMNVGAYYYSDKLVLKMHGAREVTAEDAPKLHSMVRELALRAQLPMPKVYVIQSPEANAFATGRNPENSAVAFTEGIMRTLNERELRGVAAHELAHIKNRDILVSTIAAVAASAISGVANMLQFSALFGGARDEEGGASGGQQLLMMFLAPLAATLIQMGISRSREYMADELGAKICGDPNALADALEGLHRRAEQVHSTFQPATASLYIVNPFSGVGGLMNLFSTHPPMEKRVALLRQMRLGSFAA